MIDSDTGATGAMGPTAADPVDRPPTSYPDAIRRRVSGATIWLFIVTLLLLASLGAYKLALNEIQDGRAKGSKLTCAISTAVVQGGRELVERPIPPELEAALGLHRSKKEREAQAKESGDFYVRHIGNKIAEQDGIKDGSAILNPDGSVNCEKLRSISKLK